LFDSAIFYERISTLFAEKSEFAGNCGQFWNTNRGDPFAFDCVRHHYANDIKEILGAYFPCRLVTSAGKQEVSAARRKKFDAPNLKKACSHPFRRSDSSNCSISKWFWWFVVGTTTLFVVNLFVSVASPYL
jgi:hypothetical protein